MITRLYPGRAFSLYAIVKKGECKVQEFIDSLERKDQAKILRLLQYTADNGPLRNEEKFRHIGNGIYEFKFSKARILCFFALGRKIIMTHGFLKGAKLKTEKKKAQLLREKYFAEIKKIRR